MPNVMEIWEPKPPGTLWDKPGLLRDCFTFTFDYFQFACNVTALYTRLSVHILNVSEQ